MRVRTGLILIVVSLAFSSLSIAQQLFPDGAGWYQSRDLYLTTNWGAHWKDITPQIPKGYKLYSVFFLDGSTGWVFLVGSNPEHPQYDGYGEEITGLKIAFTTSAGASWSTWDIRLPDYRHPFPALAGNFNVWFVDAEHGWMNMDIPSSANFADGALLATKDEGHTWVLVPGDSGGSGQVSFVTVNKGWIVGGPGSQHVYATGNGGKTWRDVSPKAPPELGPRVSPVYLPASFQNAKQVFLPATYSVEKETTFVLFSTQDNGRTWKRHITVPFGNFLVFNVVGSNLVTAEMSKLSLTLTTITPAGETSRQQADVPTVPWPLGMESNPGSCASDVYRLMMTDQDHGWAFLNCAASGSDELLATDNGGRSWTDVTPKRQENPRTVSPREHGAVR
jgi:photosystem II stability/assembly factor-like uncharacterized protein